MPARFEKHKSIKQRKGVSMSTFVRFVCTKMNTVFENEHLSKEGFTDNEAVAFLA